MRFPVRISFPSLQDAIAQMHHEAKNKMNKEKTSCIRGPKVCARK